MRRERGPYRYRRLQVLEGMDQDAYRPWRKPRGPAYCGRCKAVFRRGRWSWAPPPPGAARVRCPACRRADERMPGGFISVSGGFARRHRDEILARVANCEAAEKSSHPLERIIGIERGEDGALVTTTSPHLARRIGHALKQTFKGGSTQSYSSDGVLRIRWRRED